MIRPFGCHLLCIAILMGTADLARSEESKPQEGVLPAAAKEEKEEQPAAKNDANQKPTTPTTTKGPEGSAAPSPASYAVKRKPFRITVTLDGVFEAETAREIAVKPEEWNSLDVESAVSHGARVRKGDVLLTLDKKKIDQAIEDLRTELKLSKISIQQSEQQLQALEKITPLDLAVGKRSARIGQEDREQFLEVDRPFSIKMADFSLKATEQALEYEQEELRQLEKMYKADEITEETEEIVLKRARDAVEKAKFMVEYMKLAREEMLKLNLPRTGERIEDSAQRTTFEWEKEKLVLPLTVEKQRLDLVKLQMQRKKSEEKLKNLLADREMLTVHSPIDGIVYYGKCVRGKFSDSTGMAEKLCRNGSILPNQVVMTVVAPRPMFIQSTVPEAQLHDLRPGLKGIATPDGYPNLKLDAEIDDVGDIPISSESFDAKLSVRLTRKAKWLMPGMNCKVKLVPYLKNEALSVPPKCVHADELDDEQHYVWLLDKDGKPQRRPVSVGKKTDKQVEILKGLAEGDKVLLEAPKE